MEFKNFFSGQLFPLSVCAKRIGIQNILFVSGAKLRPVLYWRKFADKLELSQDRRSSALQKVLFQILQSSTSLENIQTCVDN